MLKLKFWQKAEPKLRVVEEHDWVREYVNSEVFMEFMESKLIDVFDEFEPTPSPEYEALCERVEKHTPMKGLQEKSYRGYIVDDTRGW